jgi:hypothetical protein
MIVYGHEGKRYNVVLSIHRNTRCCLYPGIYGSGTVYTATIVMSDSTSEKYDLRHATVISSSSSQCPRLASFTPT